MEFSIIDNILSITHKGNEIPFNVSYYTVKKKSIDENDIDKKEDREKNICLYINEYFKDLYNKNPNILDVTFDIYNRLREVFDDYTISSMEELIIQIKPYVYSLLSELHKLYNIKNFVDYSPLIRIPNDIDTDFTLNELIPNSRQKTYIRSDYRALLAFSLQLRLMIPIWGEFINHIKKDELNSKKEMRALTLIFNTDCYNVVFSDSQENKTVIDKLFSYISSHVKEEDINLALVVKNQISSSDYLDYLLSRIIVTKLCIGDLNYANPDLNLISLIYGYLTSLVETDANNNKVLEKNFTSQSGENIPSKLEEYKTKQSISIGDIELNKFFLNDVNLVAKRLCSSMNFSYDGKNRILDIILNNAYNFLELKGIEKVQTDIAFAVLSKTKIDNKILVSPRIMPYLEKKILINALAIASAWLWINNHKTLSLIVIGNPYNENNFISSSSSRERISAEYEDILNRVYKYSIIRGKNKNNKNVGIEWIEKTEKELSKNVWEIPKFLEDRYILEEAKIDWRNPIISMPSNIKVLLAKLLIDLNKASI